MPNISGLIIFFGGLVIVVILFVVLSKAANKKRRDQIERGIYGRPVHQGNNLCPFCSFEVLGSAKFCKKCGMKIN